jgi:hypothetical protein
VLRTLADVQPKWRLVGGAALAGFYTKHRTTRDLDLFWAGPELRDLSIVSTDCEQRLRAAGLRVDALQTHPTFVRLRAANDAETVIVDLVVDFPPVAAPVRKQVVAGAEVDVDAPEEILVSKLCALLSRSEVRDLVDVRALLESGLDLEKALAVAPSKDGGFSPLTIAWLLDQFPVEALAGKEGMSSEDARSLATFRGQLVERILRAARPQT